MAQRTKLGDGKPRLTVADDVAWRSKQAAQALRRAETPAEKVHHPGGPTDLLTALEASSKSVAASARRRHE